MRLVLVVLAAAAALLLSIPACDAGPASGPDRRFEVLPLQSPQGPVVFRFDTATGALERAALVGSRNWTPLGEAVVASGPSGRFSIDYAMAQSIPLTLIRLDRETGDTWRLAVARDQGWVAFRAPEPAKPPAEAAPAPLAPTRPAPNAAPAAPAEPAEAPTAGGDPQRVIGKVNKAEDVKAFVRGMDSENIPVEIRAWAVEQLGNVDHPDAVPHLLRAVEFEDPVMLRTAVRALAKYDDPRVRPAIAKLTSHESEEVARVATRTLENLQ